MWLKSGIGGGQRSSSLWAGQLMDPCKARAWSWLCSASYRAVLMKHAETKHVGSQMETLGPRSTNRPLNATFPCWGSAPRAARLSEPQCSAS